MYTFVYKSSTPGQTLQITYTRTTPQRRRRQCDHASGCAGDCLGSRLHDRRSAGESVGSAGQRHDVHGKRDGGEWLHGEHGIVDSGLPSGATGTFSPATITGGTGSSTLTITTLASTPVSTSTLTITGTSGALTHTAPVSLIVAAAGGSGSLSGAVSTPTTSQNLSTLGTADWAHWGLSSPASYDHKAGITALISNYTAVGSGTVNWYADHPVGFTWTGGTPTATASNSPTGLYVSGQNNGFQITAPADGTQRTLTVYVGVWNAQGKIVAHLSDNSAADYTDTTINSTTGSVAGMYTFVYKSSTPGQTLQITYTQNNGGVGNVTMQAATLQ